MMILLANESIIEGQMQIAVCLIKMRQRPDFGCDDSFAGNIGFRYKICIYSVIFVQGFTLTGL
jgi:hypothetical protein